METSVVTADKWDTKDEFFQEVLTSYHPDAVIAIDHPDLTMTSVAWNQERKSIIAQFF
jgi:hypothetical protein